jgi:hypothetical protein
MTAMKNIPDHPSPPPEKGVVDDIPFADNPGPDYTFTVASESAIGISPASSPTNEVAMVGYPATPTDVSAVASNTQINLVLDSGCRQWVSDHGVQYHL